MMRLMTAHVRRYHLHYHFRGHGHIRQGRFMAFPIQEDEHLLTVLRYIERNPLHANLAKRAGD
jgi:putative transposase